MIPNFPGLLLPTFGELLSPLLWRGRGRLLTGKSIELHEKAKSFKLV